MQIAGFAGRPFHEVAVEVIAPFTGGAIGRDALGAMAKEAYAAIRPSGRDAAGADRPQPVGARAVPRPDAGVQGRGDAVARPADGSHPGQARPARDDRRRHLRRHRRRRDRGVPRLQPRRRGDPLSARPGIGCAAPHDDDAEGSQRARRRGRGHVRRLPGAGEGDVQSPALSATGWRCRLSTRSTGRASSRR